MSDALSREEVDALLKMPEGDGEGEGEAEAGGRSRGVRPFDLLGSSRLTAHRLPGLEGVKDRFLRGVRGRMASWTGASVAATGASLELMRYATLRNRLEPGGAFLLFGLSPLRGTGLVAPSTGLAYSLVDRLFGGPGKLPSPGTERELSAVEMALVSRLCGLVAEELARAFAPVASLESRPVRMETNPAAATIAAAEDVVISLEMKLDVGGGAAGLGLALPFAAIEPLKPRLGEAAPPSAGGDREWAERFEGAVREADVEVAVELGSKEMRAREILSLRVGDLIALPTRGDDPVMVKIEGIERMLGHAGQSRGANAVRVVGHARV